MRIVYTSIIFFMILAFVPLGVLAHPGNTDSREGHTCYTNCIGWGYHTEQYHFHYDIPNFGFHLLCSSEADYINIQSEYNSQIQVEVERGQRVIAGQHTTDIASGLSQYAPGIAQGNIASTQNANNENIADLQRQKTSKLRQCRSDIDSHELQEELLESERERENLAQSQNDPVDVIEMCRYWQVTHGYGADGYCCSEEKGVIAAFVEEFPSACPAKVENETLSQPAIANVQSAPIARELVPEEADDQIIEAPEEVSADVSDVADLEMGSGESKFISFLRRLIFWRN